MNARDLEQLRRWLVSGATLADVESCEPVGMVGNIRFTEQARRAYRMLWTWCAFRAGGEAGRRQDRCYSRLGGAGLERRIERARARYRALRGDA